jgi:hypothetical protein
LKSILKIMVKNKKMDAKRKENRVAKKGSEREILRYGKSVSECERMRELNFVTEIFKGFSTYKL